MVHGMNIDLPITSPFKMSFPTSFFLEELLQSVNVESEETFNHIYNAVSTSLRI